MDTLSLWQPCCNRRTTFYANDFDISELESAHSASTMGIELLLVCTNLAPVCTCISWLLASAVSSMTIIVIIFIRLFFEPHLDTFQSSSWTGTHAKKQMWGFSPLIATALGVRIRVFTLATHTQLLASLCMNLWVSCSLEWSPFVLVKLCAPLHSCIHICECVHVCVCL